MNQILAKLLREDAVGLAYPPTKVISSLVKLFPEAYTIA